MDLLAWAVYIAKYGLAFVPLSLIPVMIFLERKGAAVIQDRPGPNRAALKLPVIGQVRGFGMVHNFTDVVKLLTKEDFIPEKAHKWFYLLAPVIPVLTAVLTPAMIPWFSALQWGDMPWEITGALIEANSSLLLLFALGALSVYGVVLGSWGSNSKFSLLGGLRSSAMMISYEVAMGLSVLGLILVVSTSSNPDIAGDAFNMTRIVQWQEANTWGFIVQPVGCLLFIVSMFAETGRTPFDVAEGESEIVGGFHTEYSSIKFALFFMGEYCHIVVASMLMATLFMGGWDLWPGFSPLGIKGGGTQFIQDNLGYVIAGLLVVKFLVILGLVQVIAKQRKRYAAFKASDHDAKMKEYGLFSAIFMLGALGTLGAAVAAALLIGTPDPVMVKGSLEHQPWVQVVTALVQAGIVLGKTLFFCWLFVWVRWTLPRLRYDQIMGLGWKVMLNIALINLLVTAVIAKFIQEGF